MQVEHGFANLDKGYQSDHNNNGSSVRSRAIA